jgi:hypothetical protein
MANGPELTPGTWHCLTYFAKTLLCFMLSAAKNYCLLIQTVVAVSDYSTSNRNASTYQDATPYFLNVRHWTAVSNQIYTTDR